MAKKTQKVMGRPRIESETTLSRVVSGAVSEDEMMMIRAAAAANEMSMSQWVRKASLRASAGYASGARKK